MLMWWKGGHGAGRLRLAGVDAILSEHAEMVKTLFLTGATGFVGRHLLPRLTGEEFGKVYCLTRARSSPPPLPANAIALEGDLLGLARYAKEIAESDCVVHLAAATGKSAPQEFFRVNVEGTRALLEQAKRGGVRRFLFISSIAARYADNVRYYYAQSKAKAEELVRSAGLAFTILRPTIVVGRGSAVLAGLERLAGLPVVPVFGNGRARVQPIAVEDLVEYILDILRGGRFQGETLEVGGPEILTMEELLRKITRFRFHREARVAHIPFGLVALPVALLEPLARGLLPVTAGQLSSFRSDGAIAPNSLFEERRARLMSVDEMLRRWADGAAANA